MWLLQLNNHPECSGLTNGSIKKNISQTAVKVFYIKFGKRSFFHPCKTLTEEEELKTEENRMRLQRNAKKMNWRSKVVLKLIEKNNNNKFLTE